MAYVITSNQGILVQGMNSGASGFRSEWQYRILFSHKVCFVVVRCTIPHLPKILRCGSTVSGGLAAQLAHVPSPLDGRDVTRSETAHWGDLQVVIFQFFAVVLQAVGPLQYPYDPCMVYLPTFGCFLCHM